MRANEYNLVAVAFFSIVLIGCSPPADTLPPTAASAVSSGGTTADPTPVAEDAAAPPQLEQASDINVQLIDYAGLNEHVRSLAGRVVVVDIWSTSCLPCMQEFPNLVALSVQYPDRLACISLNVDYIGLKKRSAESYLPKVQEFLEIQEASTITNFLASEPDEEIRGRFSVSAIPAIIVLGPDGEVLHTLTDANSGEDGFSYASDVIPKVEALLEETGG